VKGTPLIYKKQEHYKKKKRIPKKTNERDLRKKLAKRLTKETYKKETYKRDL